MPITGTVPITDIIAPTSELDVYPVTNPIYGLGGLRTVASLSERNAITDPRREVGMIVYVTDEEKYYNLVGGISNDDWREFTVDALDGAAGPQYAVQFNDGGQLSGASGLLFNTETKTVALGSEVKIAFGDGTTQGTARNFYSLTGATSPQFPLGVSGAGNTGDRLLIATGPSGDPFRSYIRFGNAWFQTVAGGGGGGDETLWGREDPVTIAVGGISEGTTFDVDTTAVEVLHQMLYPYRNAEFSSFGVGLSIASIVDLGTTSEAGTYPSTWTYTQPNNWVAGSVSISRTAPSSATLATGLSVTDSGVGVSHPVYRYTAPTALSFRIEGQQEQGANPSRSITPHNWRAKVYYGKSAQASLDSSYASYSAFSSLFSGGIGSLFTPSNTLLSSSGGTRILFPSTASPEYLWLFSPNMLTSFRTYNYFVEANSPGFQQTPSITGDIVLTNANGVSSNYVFYRWEFPTLGAPDFTVNVI